MALQRRIVPMYGEVRAPTVAPHLTYGGGPLLTAVEVYTIFWGAAWLLPAQSGLPPQLNQFFDFIVTSPLLDLLAQYSVPGQTIGHGSRIGTSTITTSEPGGGSLQVTDAQIQQALQGWIANGTIPQASSNTLYFVYLPPGVTASDPQGEVSCQRMCGYHWFIAGANPQVFYAAVPFLDCDGCLGPLTQIEAFTSTSSHELSEAITDPQLWTGWNDNLNGEIGDICAWQTQVLNGYTVQQEWSNQASACMVVGSPIVTLSRTTIDFHSVPVGYSPAPTAPVTLTNTGSASLVVTGTSISGDPSFTYLDNQTCEGATLAPGGSCTVTVEFDPEGAKVFHATLTFTDNASDSPQQVALKGIGKPSNK